MTRTALAIAVGASLCARPATVLAWGCDAHRLIAALAATRLTPVVAHRIGALTDGASLAAASCWADEFRRSHPETKRWHYVDIPRDAPAYDPERDCPPNPEGDCLLAALERSAATLAAADADAPARHDALRFLVHLLADLHQPLHCTDDGDAGGNRLLVRFFDRRTNLHAVWDRDLLDAAREAAPNQRARLLAAMRAIPPTTQVAFTAWAQESHAVGARQVYGGVPSDRRLGAAYVTAHAPALERQLARAAARLGDTLNLLLREGAAGSSDPPRRPARRPPRRAPRR